MALAPPSSEEVLALASRLGLGLGPGEVEAHREQIELNLALLAGLPDEPEPEPVRYARDAGQRPEPSHNPLGAWYRRTRIAGAPEGPLAGKSVALKDNVMLAGVPMMNGTSILEGYVPETDATIVTRMLDAGATILGKAVCEAYCFSGGSHTSATGPVRNPFDRERTTGGSSSGSAALVASGEVDLAIGCDQGGSIRIPAAFCGIVGMKPTHGLVPYTGILGFDPSIDHTGPMSVDVSDNARLLEVLAGPDGLDSRQGAVRVAPYTRALSQGAGGLRIGLLSEGFAGTEEPVRDCVRAGAARLEKLGAEVREVSIPRHVVGPLISLAGLVASFDFVFGCDGLALGANDPLPSSFLEKQRGWRERAAELPDAVKSYMLYAEILKARAGYAHVARATALARALRADYDRALHDVDLLLMPTAPLLPPKLPAPDATLAAKLAANSVAIRNTPQFNGTHHPALSLPCGMRSGLPVGLMLVGRHFEESTIYRAAHALEQDADWRTT